MSKVTKPLAGVKHIKDYQSFIIIQKIKPLINELAKIINKQ